MGAVVVWIKDRNNVTVYALAPGIILWFSQILNELFGKDKKKTMLHVAKLNVDCGSRCSRGPKPSAPSFHKLEVKSFSIVRSRSHFKI